ncbi:uncharacterized protein V1518DRAFT_421711 [Limtongia smithiae]|uniref:uncharacterized protein n=1 Tax=Limtongia smithiae TaxID=1125753 RepID=UPI0034CE22D5
MDFSALLSAEIARKKKAAAAITNPNASPPPSSTATLSSAATSSLPPVPRYLRRADIESSRAAAYRAEQAALEARRHEEHLRREREREKEERAREQRRAEAERRHNDAKRAREEKEEKERDAKRKRKSTNMGVSGVKNIENEDACTDQDTKASDNDEFDTLPEEEITIRLRTLGEPIHLFAETTAQQRARLRRLSATRTAAQLANVAFAAKLAAVPDFMISKHEDDVEKVYIQMYKYIVYLLEQWAGVLDNVGRSAAADDEDADRGRAPDKALATLAQTKSYLTPLLRHLRDESLPAGIRTPLAALFRHLQRRSYRSANDTYLRLSIGNAAWPIGVTAVGIHERSARERITGQSTEEGEDNVAHVMSDDRTRKWLTAVKRLITFVESQWPE